MWSLALTGWLVLAALCCVICYQDFSKRRISNRVVSLVAVVTALLLIYLHNYAVLPYSLLLLLIGFVLFLFKFIAGGDIKLLVAFSLAIKAQFLPLTLVIIMLSGGALALSYYLFGLLTDLDKVKARGIPYGIPICLGCLFGVAASL